MMRPNNDPLREVEELAGILEDRRYGKVQSEKETNIPASFLQY